MRKIYNSLQTCAGALTSRILSKTAMASMVMWLQGYKYVYVSVGLPPGVVNFVFGTGPSAGEAIVKHPDVPIVSFTGGTVTAVKLRIAAAPFSKKLSLEASHLCSSLFVEETGNISLFWKILMFIFRLWFLKRKLIFKDPYCLHNK